MIVVFNNDYLQALFENRTLKGKPKFGGEVVKKFKKTLLKIQYAESINELRKIKGLNFEALKGNLESFYSVRVDIQYGLILSISKNTIEIKDVLVVEDLTNHYQ